MKPCWKTALEKACPCSWTINFSLLFFSACVGEGGSQKILNISLTPMNRKKHRVCMPKCLSQNVVVFSLVD